MPDSSITKHALANALKDLMTTHSFSKISVGDICEKCGMNRKSFYYHFKDKYELIDWIFYNEFVAIVHQEKIADGWDIIERLNEYFYQNKAFYKNALMVTGQNSFREYFEKIFQTTVMKYLENSFSSNENATFFAKFFSDASCLAIINWLKEEPCMSAKKFSALIKESMQDITKKAAEEFDV